MKNLQPSRYPTPEELYALELDARRLRAEEMARLIRAGAHALKARVSSLFGAKVMRHA